MRLAAWCVAALCLALAGCVYLPDIRIYNQSGETLVLHLNKPPEVARDPWIPYDLRLEPGKQAKIASIEFKPVIVIHSGGCAYNYGTAVTELWKTSSAIVVQIEPDFVMHLLNRKHSQHWVGRFRDGEAEGFPITPTKTCAQTRDDSPGA